MEVLCLCARWCHLCTAYAPVFAQVVQALRTEVADLRSRWIDIEDDADLVGDVDVETFPTIVVRRGAQVLFHGPLPPQPELLLRVVRAALATPPDAAPPVPPEVAAFARRLAAGA